MRDIIKESLRQTLIENGYMEGTPKQNAFLKKLMGDRWKDEYAGLGTRETSAMIDKELGKAPGSPIGGGYEVVDTIVDGHEIIPCNTFPEAKKKLEDAVQEYFDLGFFNEADLRFVKESDIMYACYGRNSRRCYGRLYIRKKK
jgi:hypothetical protein